MSAWKTSPRAMPLTCLFCRALLSSSATAEEHVIPNALGGQLVTRKATCATCNSKAGSSIDARLTSRLAFLANVLDVERSRGKTPTIDVKDPESRLEYVIAPGRQPTLGPNLSVAREDSRIGIGVLAPTAQEAQRLIRRLTKKKVPPEELQGEPFPSRQYSFDIDLFDFGDPLLLRALAKIAVAFAREKDVNTDGPALRFLREEEVKVCPVAPVDRDLVTFEELPSHPVTHGVYLFAPASGSRLFAHVVLFECIEALVLLCDVGMKPGWHGAYRYNIVHSGEEQRRCTWVATDEELSDCLRRSEPDGPRLQAKSEHIRWWIRHMDELRTERALAAAVRVYNEARDRGVSEKAAEEAANRTASRLLAPHGLSLGVLSFTESP